MAALSVGSRRVGRVELPTDDSETVCLMSVSADVNLSGIVVGPGANSLSDCDGAIVDSGPVWS